MRLSKNPAWISVGSMKMGLATRAEAASLRQLKTLWSQPVSSQAPIHQAV
jgi:hypothetical protein